MIRVPMTMIQSIKCNCIELQSIPRVGILAQTQIGCYNYLTTARRYWSCLNKQIGIPSQRSRTDFSLVIDIHAGEGGEDSRLFARDLLAAYLRYAQNLAFKSEIVYDSESSWSVRITSENCWDSFANESGKHIVQRIPPTESKGRRHTSTVSVAVLPLPPKVDTELVLDEIEIIVQRGHGKGGQHQNKVESAVRAIHKPTGISVFINGRDQLRNKQLALEILAARICERKREELRQQAHRAKAEQIGFGTRSGKIRTYNFIRSYIMNHRTGCKTHRIEEVMKGRFDLIK